MPEPRPDTAALMETVVRGLSRPGYGGDGKWLPAHPSEAETLEAPAAATALAERFAEAEAALERIADIRPEYPGDAVIAIGIARVALRFLRGETT